MGGVDAQPGWTPLDGDGWRCRAFLGDEWEAARLGEPGSPGPGGWLPASVPGSVVADLVRAGEVPDPYRDRNSRFAEWVAERWWAYQTDFEAGSSALDGRAELVLDGIDPGGRVYLDGELLGEHDGMFVPARFEVGDRLRGAAGRHLLTVLLAPAPRAEPQTGDTARVRTHRARMNYGWDFCPRLVHQGVWQSVGLRRTGAVRLERPFVRARPNADRSSATLDCQVVLDAAHPTNARVVLQARLAGSRVAATSTQLQLATGGRSVELALELSEPVLWWPNGYGEQALYEVELSVEVDGRCSDRRVVSTGVRSLRLEQNDDAPAGARPYRFVVNEVPVYANGWNWVPIDMLYGVPHPARLGHLLGLARRAHVNVLRVWGGGLIESEAFYAACDRLGILVWQEFSQSSSGTLNAPAEDEAFVAMMAAQAEQIVPLRRNHPSLAVWCGGNELMRDGRPLDESAPVLGALADVVRRLDPDRPFLPTSPTGPVANFVDTTTDQPGHDVHGPWEHQGIDRQQQLYNGHSALLHSEFGVEGMTNRATIEATISAAWRWPPTRDNPVYAHRGAWWINEPLVQAAFGGGIDDLPTLARASQLLQADGLRYAVESSLRRRWHSSGTLPWQFNEPFPNAWCTSAVDYFGRPKPAYHAVAAAYEPLHVGATFERQAWAGADLFAADIWATSNHRQAKGGRLIARCLAADGSLAGQLELETECRPLAATALGRLVVPVAAIASELFLLDLSLAAEGGATVSRNRYVFSRTQDLSPLRALPPVRLELERLSLEEDRWRLQLRNAGHWLAPALRIEDGRPAGAPGWAIPDADHVSLLPGEAMAIGVDFSDVPPADRRLLVSGWNVEEQLVG